MTRGNRELLSVEEHKLAGAHECSDGRWYTVSRKFGLKEFLLLSRNQRLLLLDRMHAAKKRPESVRVDYMMALAETQGRRQTV